MRKVLFLAVILLVMAGWTMAQTTGSTPGQTGSSAQTGQNPSATPSTSEQNPTTGTSGQTSETGTERHGKLPQTASPLPLLALLGVGSLSAGLAARRRKS